MLAIREHARLKYNQASPFLEWVSFRISRYMIVACSFDPTLLENTSHINLFFGDKVCSIHVFLVHHNISHDGVKTIVTSI